MASVKSFKPPKKSKLAKKPAVSLTDIQYEEIFFSAIYPSQSALNIQYSLKADLPGNEAKSPTECAVIKDKQTHFGSNSILHLGDVSSDIIKKLKKLRNLKKASEKNGSDSKIVSIDSTGPPKKLSKRERLLWLQDKRGSGMYVKCDDEKCAKWRWLDNPDPVDLPPKWYCYMNPDKSLAACSVPESKIPKDVEDDLVHNSFSPGSIVWAKMVGYPWWPAMVDDCPDCEQYYWINVYGELVPDYYNVVFFDNDEVSRRWILVKNLKSYKHNLDFDKTFKLPLIYKTRMRLSKEKANIALKLHIKDRLKSYSFVALWKGEIPEYLSSDDDDDDSDLDEVAYIKKLKRKILQRKRAHEKRRNSTDFNQAVRLNQNHSNSLATISHNKNDKSRTATKAIENSKPAKEVMKIFDRSDSKTAIKTISKSSASQKNISDEDKQSNGKENLNKDFPKTIAEGKTIPRSYNTVDSKKNMSNDDKQSKVKENLNKYLPKTIAESKTIPRSYNKIDIKENTSNDDKQSKGKENLNKDLPETIAEGKSIPKSNNKMDDQQNIPDDDKQNKGKENLNKDLPKPIVGNKLKHMIRKIKNKSSEKRPATSVDNSSSSEAVQIFRPVDLILDTSKVKIDRDLAQKAYDLCLNLFTSGEHGEAQFEKIYKIITKNNNNEILSPKVETKEEPEESSKESPENEEEIIKEDPKEKLSETTKNQFLETSHTQDLLQPQVKKRKIEDKLSKVVKVIKLAQKAHDNAIQNTISSDPVVLE